MVKDINYNTDAQEFASFIAKDKKNYKIYFFFGIIILIIILFQCSPFFFGYQETTRELGRVSYKLRSLSSKITIIDTYQNLIYWLQKFGLNAEVLSFNVVSLFIFNFCYEVCNNFNSAIIISSCIILSTGILQLSFVLMLCWKIWIAYLIYVAIRYLYSVTPYKGNDIMGVGGNGRVFYSGIRANIKNCDDEGNPMLHIPGFTCLNQVSKKIYSASAFCKLLQRYGAENLTNEYLSSTILNYYDYPAYVKGGIGIGNLYEDTYEFLQFAFEIKEEIDKYGDVAEKHFKDSNSKKEDLIYCLSKEMKQNLKNIPYKNIATAILALEAGRIMAYDHLSNDRWAIVSNYPHLGARAVLHSVPYYKDEYSFREKEYIRQSIIFAERKSDFLQIRMPLKMNLNAYTLRQWLELILNYDKKNQILDELLYFALSTRIHKEWTKVLCDFLKSKRDFEGNLYMAESGQLFMKLKLIMKILSASLKKEIKDMSDIIEKIYIKRETDNMVSKIEQKKLSDDNNEFLKEFSEETKRDMLRFLSTEEIVIWQNLRSCLNSYSWIGKRVSDRYVSSSAVIDCLFLLEDDTRLQEDGMVFLRTSKLNDFLGENWSDRIQKVKKVSITKDSAMKLIEE